jgi:SRSO17 transposase
LLALLVAIGPVGRYAPLPSLWSAEATGFSNRPNQASASDGARLTRSALQQFLSLLQWDEDRMRDRLQALVRDEHAGPHTIGIFDETSDAKKGEKTPGVQKQWCGRLGKTENCIVTVHLGYAAAGFHCLLDGEDTSRKPLSD